jgi:RimJ/RimL family protein N-acetyltransferase
LLEGKNVNLRVIEKVDLLQSIELVNNPDYWGEYNPFLAQMSKAELEKAYDNPPSEGKSFWIEKKDGSKIGMIGHHLHGRAEELGYAILPSERGKGYCSEALNIMVDYLFPSKDTVRIQALTDVRNVASQKILAKVGFMKEGVVRKDYFRGDWRDCCLYSILREEWKEPKILTRAS